MARSTPSRTRISAKRFCFILCIYLLITSAPIPAESQLKVQGAPEIHADKSSGSGTTLLYLRNDSTSPFPVVLSAAPLASGRASAAMDAQVNFAAENDAGPGEAEYRFTLPAGKATKVRAFVIRAWGSFPVDMDLRNGSASFGTLRIFPSPMNVSLVEPPADKPELNIMDKIPGRIILKNDDPVSYALSYRLVVAGRQLAGNEFQMPPQRTIILEFVPTVAPDWGVWPTVLARLQEIFKARVEESGTLYLYQRQGAAVDYSSPVKMLSFSTSLDYFSPAWRGTLNYVLIVFILILGGVASLTFGHSLPNLLAKLSIVEQLNELARITSNLSSNIDSRLGVLMRLERSRLNELLDSRKTISPDFTTILSQCKDRLAKLTSRVDLSQQLDVVIERLKKLARAGAPPASIANINECLQQTCESLKIAVPADTDLQDARKSIAAINARLDTINRPNSDASKALFQTVQDVMKTIPATGTNTTFDRISKAVPGPTAVLKAVPATPPEIVSASYAGVDIALWKIQIMRDYAIFAEGTTNTDTKTRLQKWEGQLISHLSFESWEELQAAKLLLQEMKADVYPERLFEILVKKEAAIKMEPATAYEEEPLEFSVDFGTRMVNTAAAQEEWICSWKFGDGLQAQGWQISHYYILPKPKWFQRRQPCEFEVTASFHDEAGKQVVEPSTKAGASDPVVVRGKFKVHPSKLRDWLGERTVAEVARLSVALLVAVFALVAGVKDQLAKLDVLPGLIAVFVAGYGVDVLKNLINSDKSS
jgi:hypothetical protein